MSATRFTHIAMAFFFLCLGAFLVAENIRKPRIFILHSYNTDFSWVRDIDVGIERSLLKKNYKIRHHYMDTKRHPAQSFKEKAGATARQEIESWQPDVIIAVDDDAQEYVGKYYRNDPRIKVVFSGVNKTPQDYGYDKADNITGVLERINYRAIKDILVQVLPEGRRRIMHISDASSTSEGIHNEIGGFDWSPLQFQDSRQVDTFEEWKQVIKAAEGKTDFLLLTHYHTLRRSAASEEVVPPQEVMKWTIENSSLPGISFWGFYVEDGGMMAVALSPYEQGEVAARMAVDIIDNGKRPKDIPVYESHLFVMYMRGSQIRERMGGMNLPLVYESFARAMNTYYE